ncbi:MAG: flagellar motor stator protein MotA [Gammaproteobacteria bacterium]
MLVIFGYLIVLFSVFGGYVLSGGHLYALFQPFEFMIIGGAALGSFVVSNNMKVIKATFKGAFSTLKGHNYTKKFYIQLLSLFFELTNKIRKDGVLSIENDIENFKESPIFSKYPLIQKQNKIMEFLCDHLRLVVTGRVDLHQLEMLMDEDIDTYEKEGELPINAISKVSDSFPAFGIVAAVMGVVMTMQAMNGSPEVLGEHVAKALVGTFLGVLTGYGFTSPIAAILENRLHAEVTILQSIKIVLLASIHNLAPVIAVEFARKLLYSAERPSSTELEQILKELRSGAAQKTQ